MKKRFSRWISILVVSVMLVSMMSVTAFADKKNDCVVIGADLTDAQIAGVYEYFGIERGSVTELKVTNAEERSYLSGIAPESMIGSYSLSCVYIRVLEDNAGIGISTNNINWCSSQMYTAALVTAGITGADVKITAPCSVSGTAALTGIYKAYETITGETLSEDAKNVSIEELVLTGKLSEAIGSEEASELITQLKGILDETQNMTDDEVRAEIRSISKSIGAELTDDEVEQILKLVRRFEGLDVNELTERLKGVAKTLEKGKDAIDKANSFSQKVSAFFEKLGGFFSRLFG